MASTLDFSLPPSRRKARFDSLYRELELHRAVLRVYTKPLFAWRKALCMSHDGRTLYDFARHTPRNVGRIHKALAREQFHFREGVELKYNFNGKHRTIYMYPWEERIVDVLLYHLLNRCFHTVFSGNSFAYRFRGFGVDCCQHGVARRLGQMPQPVYLFKRDIADYFPSVDHNVLLTAIKEWVEPDDYLFELLRQRIEFRWREDDTVVTADRGIPFGTAIACFFANFYLTPLDRQMAKVPGVAYFRYADDMLAFSSDRGRTLEAMHRFNEVIHELRLASKPSQHLDFSFGQDGGSDDRFEPRTKFRHLGLEFRADGSIGLSRDKARKIRNLFRFAFRRNRRKLASRSTPESRAQLAIDIAKEVVETGVRSIAIIDYYLKHVDDEEQLRQIDRWLAEEVLSIAFRNGHRKGNFRLLSFGRMREMGLPSLRHRRRLLRHGHIKSSFFVLRTERLIERERRRLPGPRAFSPSLEAAAKSPS